MSKVFFSLTGNNRKWSGRFKKNVIKIGESDYRDLKFPFSFYVSLYDITFDGVDFTNCLRPQDFQYMRDNPNVKLFVDLEAEFFDNNTLISIKDIVSAHNIKTNQIEILLQDETQKLFAQNYFQKNDIFDISFKVFYRHLLVVKIPKEITYKKNNKKFSMFIRRHAPSRLKLVIELHRAKLLNHFIWSYQYAIDNFMIEVGTFESDKSFYLSELENLGYESSEELNALLDILPKRIVENDLAFDQNDDIIYDTLMSTDFHLLVETIFDPTIWSMREGSFPIDVSEKTYKAVACGVPFLVAGTYKWLEHLKSIGYKTFSPFINENYDEILDPSERLTAIVEEVKRLTSLPEDEYNHTLENCRQIALENRKIFLEKKQQIISSDK